MNLFPHVNNKANKLDLKIVPSLGRTHFVVNVNCFFSAVTSFRFKGTLFECNQYLNDLIKKKAAA